MNSKRSPDAANMGNRNTPTKKSKPNTSKCSSPSKAQTEANTIYLLDSPLENSTSSTAPLTPAGFKLTVQKSVIDGQRSLHHDRANKKIKLNFNDKSYFNIGSRTLFGDDGKEIPVTEQLHKRKCCVIIKDGVDGSLGQYAVALIITQPSSSIAVTNAGHEQRRFNSAQHGQVIGLRLGDIISFEHYNDTLSRHRWKLEAMNQDEILREEISLNMQKEMALTTLRRPKFSLEETEARKMGEDFFSCKNCEEMLVIPYFFNPCTRCKWCKSCVDQGFNKFDFSKKGKKKDKTCQGCAATKIISPAIVDEQFKNLIFSSYKNGLLNYQDEYNLESFGDIMYEEAIEKCDDDDLKNEVRQFKEKKNEGSSSQPLELD